MNLFADLGGAENTALFQKLDHAGHAYDVLAAGALGTPEFERYIGAWQEVNGLLSDLNDVRPENAPPVSAAANPPALHVDVPAAVPTGTGWPVAT